MANIASHALIGLTALASYCDETLAACRPGVAQLPVVVAHRGSTTNQPENTLAAFAWAEQIGADMIELDIRFTADGQPVVIHDESVNRTTNGRGAVNKLTLTELLALDAGQRQSVPTLEAALAFSEQSQMPLLLDLKDPQPNVGRIVHAVRSYGVAPQVTVGTHSIATLLALHREAPDITTLAFARKRPMVADFLAQGVDIVRLWAKWLELQPNLLAEVSAAGGCAWVTTGRLQGKRLQRIMQRGADGLITDHPVTALRLRAALAGD